MRIHAGSLALFHVIVKRVGGHGDERDGFGIRIAHMADVIGRRIHCEGLGDFLDIPGIVFSIDLILFMTSNGFVLTGRGWVWYFLLKLLLRVRKRLCKRVKVFVTFFDFVHGLVGAGEKLLLVLTISGIDADPDTCCHFNKQVL